MFSLNLIEKYWLTNLSTSESVVIAIGMALLLGISTVFWIPYDIIDKKQSKILAVYLMKKYFLNILTRGRCKITDQVMERRSFGI